jgi:transposase
MQKPLPEFAAFVGLDWSDKKHDVCLAFPGCEQVEQTVIEHRASAIAAWAQKLRERFVGGHIAICVELSEGPIVSALLEHDIFVIFPVNPATLARYRRAFAPSGAKDDPTDAQIALELLLRHRDKLAPLQRDSTAMRALRRLVEARRSFVQDRVRVTNRMTSALKAYFPQVLEWFRDKGTLIFADFVERWPTLQAAQRVRTETLVDFFHAHNVRRSATVERRVSAIKAEQPITTDVAVIQSCRLLLEVLLPQLRVLIAAIDKLDAEIAALCASLSDYKLFTSLPGAGPIFASRLLTAFGERRERFANAAAVQKYAGVAPVTERSGKQCWVHWRYCCAKFVRQTFVEWAAETIPRSFWAGTFYRNRREAGDSHQAALRALAFKWIRILYRCWVDRTPYDESRYLLALQKRQAPLLKFAVKHPS